MSHQLIQVEATGKVSTIALTLGQISTETAKIKTVCIVGPTRTGKSFLLNCLANKENLFKVENGGCVTKGANISKIPVLIEKVFCVNNLRVLVSLDKIILHLAR